MQLVVIDIQISFNTDTFPVIIEYDLVGVIVPLFSTTLIAVLVFRIHYGIDLHLLVGLVAWVLSGHAPAPVDGLLLALSFLSFFLAVGLAAHKLGAGKELL